MRSSACWRRPPGRWNTATWNGPGRPRRRRSRCTGDRSSMASTSFLPCCPRASASTPPSCVTCASWAADAGAPASLPGRWPCTRRAWRWTISPRSSTSSCWSASWSRAGSWRGWPCISAAGAPSTPPSESRLPSASSGCTRPCCRPGPAGRRLPGTRRGPVRPHRRNRPPTPRRCSRVSGARPRWSCSPSPVWPL